LSLTEGSEFQATQMENSKINQKKTKEQFAMHMFRDLQQQHGMVLTTYHNIPTDFISSTGWMLMSNISIMHTKEFSNCIWRAPYIHEYPS
jgi:hypothetical protein